MVEVNILLETSVNTEWTNYLQGSIIISSRHEQYGELFSGGYIMLLYEMGLHNVEWLAGQIDLEDTPRYPTFTRLLQGRNISERSRIRLTTRSMFTRCIIYVAIV